MVLEVSGCEANRSSPHDSTPLQHNRPSPKFHTTSLPFHGFTRGESMRTHIGASEPRYVSILFLFCISKQ